MENAEASIRSTNEFVTALEGKQCWTVVAGDGTGSAVSFSFGEKIPRECPVKNAKISHDARFFDGELKLFVQGGSIWEVDDNDTVLCTNDSDNKDGREMLTGLDALLGKRVTSIWHYDDFLELMLYFVEGLFELACVPNGMSGFTLFRCAYPVAVFSAEKLP